MRRKRKFNRRLNYEKVGPIHNAVYNPDLTPYLRICVDCSSLVTAQFVTCPRCFGNRLRVIPKPGDER